MKSQVERNRKYTAVLRSKVFTMLGNKCANPYNRNHGDFLEDFRCLQLDHKNGGGAEEVHRIGQVAVLRRALEHPDQYQILCANCNWIKRYTNGENKNGKTAAGVLRREDEIRKSRLVRYMVLCDLLDIKMDLGLIEGRRLVNKASEAAKEEVLGNEDEYNALAMEHVKLEKFLRCGEWS